MNILKKVKSILKKNDKKENEDALQKELSEKQLEELEEGLKLEKVKVDLRKNKPIPVPAPIKPVVEDK